MSDDLLQNEERGLFWRGLFYECHLAQFASAPGLESAEIDSASKVGSIESEPVWLACVSNAVEQCGNRLAKYIEDVKSCLFHSID